MENDAIINAYTSLTIPKLDINLSFGTIRDQVRSQLPYEYKVLKRSQFATGESDIYTSLGLHTCYDQNDQLWCFLVDRPLRLYSSEIPDVQLNDGKGPGVIAAIRRAGFRVRVLEDARISEELGFLLTVSASRVLSVTIFSRDYRKKQI